MSISNSTQHPDCNSQPPDAAFFNFSGMSILWIKSASMDFSKSWFFEDYCFGKPMLDGFLGWFWIKWSMFKP